MRDPKPFLKWAGGKRALAPLILARLPERIATYYEPFVGGGAVFFALAARRRFERAVLSDKNPDLIDAWNGVKSSVEEVIALLRSWPHDRAFYEELRARSPQSLAERAARIIYLNRTGFNGLYRVNSRGQFNVPFGRYKNPAICDEDTLRAASVTLREVQVLVKDFELAVRSAGPKDAVYFDPPYLPVSRTASFTSYHREAFGEDEHRRLVQVFCALAARGVAVVLSNSDVPEARKLVKGFPMEKVQVRRAINSRADRRGPVSEILVWSPGAARMRAVGS